MNRLPPPIRPAAGFTLLEILLSLLVMAGSMGLFFSGLQTAETLDRQAGSEERAARAGEREIELLKNDLVAGRRPREGAARGRFRLPAGWKSVIRWAPLADEESVRLCARVLKPGVDVQVESFLFLPPSAPPPGGKRK
ncbi:MAG: hypothetical protein GX442_08240 [Candidatus Riflebacteria bacterium]|nr:hypothetical protein [Candidatus Riflebacteria bacterium]